MNEQLRPSVDEIKGFFRVVDTTQPGSLLDQAIPLNQSMPWTTEYAVVDRLITAGFVAKNLSPDFDPSLVMSVYNIFAAYPDQSFAASSFDDCLSVEEIQRKLDVFTILSKGRLKDFRGFYIIDLLRLDQEYYVTGHVGRYEAADGFEVGVRSLSMGEIVFAGGNVHRFTDVLTIQGKKGRPEELTRFRELFGIHPANFALLMFLKMGQMLGHERVSIAGSADTQYNSEAINSSLYDIPRNHFRVKRNPESGRYEFGVETRDRILDKFAQKHPIVAQSFREIEGYMANAV